jgi:hypothetical protein
MIWSNGCEPPHIQVIEFSSCLNNRRSTGGCDAHRIPYPSQSSPAAAAWPAKAVMTPDGPAPPTSKPRRDNTLTKALVRAHRWRRQIESGRAKSITDLAEQEGVTDAYVCRLLPLTCLAPNIVEAILDGRQPKGLRLAKMLGNGPVSWNEQCRALGFCRPA